MGLTYHDVIRAFQSGTSYTVGCSGCSTMDPELYVAGAVEDDRGPVVEYSLQRRPTHLLWRVIEQRPDYGILWSFVGSDVTPHDFPSAPQTRAIVYYRSPVQTFGNAR